MDLTKAMQISAAGMKAQGTRMRIIAENIANERSIANGPGDEPYRRRVVTFANELDRQLGVELVKVKSIRKDPSDFGRKYEPSHPAADKDGYVTTTNVNGLIEEGDMKEASRTYEANLSAIEAAKNLLMRTLDLLR
ncbi:MAG: flagellar basal body rod protein FlgC [Pseudomonadota bacterium]